MGSALRGLPAVETQEEIHGNAVKALETNPSAPGVSSTVAGTKRKISWYTLVARGTNVCAAHPATRWNSKVSFPQNSQENVTKFAPNKTPTLIG